MPIGRQTDKQKVVAWPHTGVSAIIRNDVLSPTASVNPGSISPSERSPSQKTSRIL